MQTKVVAIVGRPNVGKSSLFNKLIGERKSIVDDTKGVTRDRSYSYCEWTNKKFILIDTGGIETNEQDKLYTQMKKQALIAIDEADMIIFLTDVRDGLTTQDIEVGEILRRSDKEIIVAVNKCDSIGKNPIEFYEFYNLGFEKLYPISSLHGHGLGDMLDEITKDIEPTSQEEDTDKIKISIVGRPNVGKSSLINFLLGKERMIVSNIAGTTRDSVDAIIKKNDKEYTFIDTAGIRKKSKVLESIEKYSVMRAQMSIDRSDLVLLLIDAEVGVTEQDSKIAGYAFEKGKGSIIVVNKWDLIEKDNNTIKEFDKKIRLELGFITYSKIIYISAKTGQRVNNLYNLIDGAYNEYTKRIPTGELNEMMSYATARVEPPTDRGKRLKIYYITQTSIKPPTFIIFVNNKELFHFSYKRYIENQLRQHYGFQGTPIIIILRERKKEK